MSKKNYEDEWFEPAYFIGIGQYQRIGEPGKSKIKHPVGFIRPKIVNKRVAAQKVRKNTSSA